MAPRTTAETERLAPTTFVRLLSGAHESKLQSMSTLKRSGVDLYYELSGQGPPVLLIQGVGVVGEGWRPQVDALKSRFQTLIFDSRGIGKSAPCNSQISIEAMAEDARALMDAAGWESAHVV